MVQEKKRKIDGDHGDHKGPIIQISVPKGSTVTGKFYKNIVLRKLKHYYKSHRPKTGLKYLALLHDNASAQKARSVTKFLELEVSVLPYPPFLTDLAPYNYFVFPNLNIICLERDTNQEMPLD